METIFGKTSQVMLLIFFNYASIIIGFRCELVAKIPFFSQLQLIRNDLQSNSRVAGVAFRIIPLYPDTRVG
jgi:hypothetical protein